MQEVALLVFALWSSRGRRQNLSAFPWEPAAQAGSEKTKGQPRP
jgi:hypothetical protein